MVRAVGSPTPRAHMFTWLLQLANSSTKPIRMALPLAHDKKPINGCTSIIKSRPQRKDVDGCEPGSIRKLDMYNTTGNEEPSIGGGV